MDGYLTHNQRPGTWSDDTSLTLATMDSLAKGLNYEDMMNNFSKWYNEGEYTPFNEAFDVGNTTSRAILKFGNGYAALDCGMSSERDNGNGSLMRILPISIYTISKNIDFNSRFEIINSVSKLTHAHMRTLIACSIYTFIVEEILKENNNLNDSIDKGINSSLKFFKSKLLDNNELSYFNRIFNKSIFDLDESEISSSAYVVDTLEASIWVLYNTSSYNEAILKSVNLGNDTDTIGAVCGSLAGLYYGYDSISSQWLDTLVKKDYIEKFISKFYTSLKE